MWHQPRNTLNKKEPYGKVLKVHRSQEDEIQLRFFLKSVTFSLKYPFTRCVGIYIQSFFPETYMNYF